MTFSVPAIAARTRRRQEGHELREFLWLRNHRRH